MRWSPKSWTTLKPQRLIYSMGNIPIVFFFLRIKHVCKVIDLEAEVQQNSSNYIIKVMLKSTSCKTTNILHCCFRISCYSYTPQPAPSYCGHGAPSCYLLLNVPHVATLLRYHHLPIPSLKYCIDNTTRHHVNWFAFV